MMDEEALARWILRQTRRHKDVPLDAAQIGFALGKIEAWAINVVFPPVDATDKESAGERKLWSDGPHVLKG